ncbi:MAG: DUF4124 domain-containing protein [Gammaproteobacteria bacterium]
MHKNRFCLAAAALLIANGVIPLANAEIYKWTDEDGQVHYSQSPPPGDRQAETIDATRSDASEEALQELEKDKARAEALRKARLEEQREKKQAEEEKAWKEENCRRARDRLHSYSVPNALIKQQDGSRIRVDEETRQKELARAREMIQKYCE